MRRLPAVGPHLPPGSCGTRCTEAQQGVLLREQGLLGLEAQQSGFLENEEADHALPTSPTPLPTL